MNTKLYKHQWEVPSHSSDKTYKVSEKHTGEFVCSCPHNIFRKLECDHIRETVEFEKERKRLLEAQKRIKFFGITFLQ